MPTPNTRGAELDLRSVVTPHWDSDDLLWAIDVLKDEWHKTRTQPTQEVAQ